MSIEQCTVWEIVVKAVSKNVDVPEFQREFVWDPEQVKKLAESLYREYPIGLFLLWDSSEYQEAKTAQGAQASLWIVDGQQRITALCLLFGQKPYWWDDAESWNKALERYDVMVNLFPETAGERLEFALPNPIRRKDPRWINIRRILSIDKQESLTTLALELSKRISNESSQMMNVFEKVHANIQCLWEIRKRIIPIIKISHEVEDVAEIFARLNQEGTRVKEADVVLALVAVRNPGWVRDEYLPFRRELENRGWDLETGIFVRTMTSIGKGRARLIEVPKDFWDSRNLEKVWTDTKKAISDVLRRLAEFGITSADLIPSTNSLIPLFVLDHRWISENGELFKKAMYWFLLANRDGRYSGSAITSLNEDVRTITEAKSFDEAIENLLKRLRVSTEIDGGEFLNRYDRSDQRFLRLMLYLLLYHRGARDWIDKTRIGYDTTGAPITIGFEPQWHHIYPRSVLKKAGFSDNEINALANITVMNEITNIKRLANKPPARYIQEFSISEEDLRMHLIPESFACASADRAKQWDIKRYEDFLIERAQLLAHEANKLLQELKE